MKNIVLPVKCEICNREFASTQSLVNHIYGTHKMKAIDYAKTYLMDKDDNVCPICKGETTFLSITRGFTKYCKNCFNSKNNVERIKKITKTRHENNETWVSDLAKERLRNNNISKYGCEHYFQSNEFKQKMQERYQQRNSTFYENVKNKQIDTLQRKYGETVTNASQLNFVKEKKKLTYRLHSGYDYPMQNPQVKEKFIQQYVSKAIEKCKEMNKDEFVSYNDGIVTYKCAVCGSEYNITVPLLQKRSKNEYVICTKCNSDKNNITSQYEKEISYFIEQYGFSTILNERTILNGKEIDIYIPEKKLAIEFDGLYWHNELHKDKNYHLCKTEECLKHGIQLIHIFEDEWLFQTNIVKSRLRGLLGINERIFARNTECKEISFEEAKQFLEENHIQGSCVSKYQYGLFHKDELVSVMSFGQNRFTNGRFELLRFANMLNTNVIGGASKLFKHFLNEHSEITEIDSFADRRWSNGYLYEKLEFTQIQFTVPSYFYIVNGIRENRIKYQKHKLVKEGFDQNKTEHEIMLEREIYRIYDCGNIKYTYYKKS